MRKKAKQGCQRCHWFKQRHRYSFTALTRWGTFDVDHAEKLARNGQHELHELSQASLKRIALRDGWESDRGINRSHVPHVHPSKALIFGSASDGRRGRPRIFLIEGHHRGLRHLWEGRPAKYYLLSLAETRLITLRRRTSLSRAKSTRPAQHSPRALAAQGGA